MILLRWILSAATIILVGSIVPGVHVDGWWAALVAAVALGLLNAVLRPLLILLTLPISLLTLGLFTLIINATIFLFASTIIKGFSVDSFGAAFFGSLLLWVLNWGISGLLKR